MELTKEQIESLAMFALDILDDFPDLGIFDGGDIQDAAVKHNILVPRIVYARCGEDCNCAEYYDEEEWQDGVTCYHIADWLDRVAEQRDAPVHAEQKCPECGMTLPRHYSDCQTFWNSLANTGISNRSAGG